MLAVEVELMSVILRFDGDNDRAIAPLVAAAPYTPNGFRFKFRVKFNDFAPSGFRLAVELGANGAGFGIGLRPDGQFRVRIRNSEFSIGAGVLGVEYEFEFFQASGAGFRDVVVTVNDAPLASMNTGDTTYSTTWLLIGDDNRGGNSEIDFYEASWEDFTSPANNSNWDANLSDHAAGNPEITDTLLGNNAISENMPNAGIGQPGSAWIDLGGSGVTVTVDSQMPSMVSVANFSQTVPAINLSASIASLMPSMESSANFTQSSPSGNNSTINSTMPSMASAALFSQVVPEFDSSIISVMPSMISSATIQNLTPGNNSSIFSVMPSMVSSATFTIEDPKILDAAIISTMPSMQSSATLFNGIISIVIGEGNNIDIVVKSRNINIKTKSRII